MEDETDDVLQTLLSVIYRLAPQNADEDVIGACQLVPDRADQVLQRVQRPARLIYDAEASKYFIGSDYNKIAEVYRSPWSGSTPRFYYSDGRLAVTDEAVPSNDVVTFTTKSAVRDFELSLNHKYSPATVARKGHSSVYVWPFQKATGFAVAFHLYNAMSLPDSRLMSGGEFILDTTHVVHVTMATNTAFYRGKTTTYFTLQGDAPDMGEISFGARTTKLSDGSKFMGNLSEASQSDLEFHTESILSLVETAEKALLWSLREIGISKAIHGLAALRIADDGQAATHKAIQEELNQKVTEIAAEASANNRLRDTTRVFSS